MIGQKLPNCPAIAPGKHSIPTPTVPPKITAIPNPRPRMREREARATYTPPSAALVTPVDIQATWPRKTDSQRYSSRALDRPRVARRRAGQKGEVRPTYRFYG